MATCSRIEIKEEQNGAYLHTKWYNTEFRIRFSFVPLNSILGKAIELSNGFRLKHLSQRQRHREKEREEINIRNWKFANLAHSLNPPERENDSKWSNQLMIDACQFIFVKLCREMRFSLAISEASKSEMQQKSICSIKIRLKWLGKMNGISLSASRLAIQCGSRINFFFFSSLSLHFARSLFTFHSIFKMLNFFERIEEMLERPTEKR